MGIPYQFWQFRILNIMLKTNCFIYYFRTTFFQRKTLDHPYFPPTVWTCHWSQQHTNQEREKTKTFFIENLDCMKFIIFSSKTVNLLHFPRIWHSTKIPSVGRLARESARRLFFQVQAPLLKSRKL